MQLADLSDELNEIIARLRELNTELKSDTLLETSRLSEELDNILGED